MRHRGDAYYRLCYYAITKLITAHVIELRYIADYKVFALLLCYYAIFRHIFFV